MSMLALSILCLCALAALALGMEKHWHQVSQRALAAPARKALRLAGWIVLTMALLAGVIGWDGSVGIVAWLGVLSIAGLILVFALPKFSHRPSSRTEHAAQHPLSSFAVSSGRMRVGQWVAACALVATPIAFAWQLHEEETRPLLREDALRGTAGPWSFVFAESDREPPELVAMDIPMKHYQIRFCDACDRDIRAVYLKVNKPRSARATGMGFEGARRERNVAIQMPANLSGDKELWLTVEGKDGSTHQVSWRMDAVSPSTVAWFEQLRAR